MKIIAISDLHGYLPEITEPFDLLLIAGDICPAHDHYYSYQINWLQHNFAKWITNLPFSNEWSKVVMTWGNHDFVGEIIGKEELQCLNITTGNRLIVLNNEEYKFEYLTDNGVNSLKIFATPYCKVFGNWAFMRENLEKYYDFIPDGIDILISHDAADIDDLGTISQGRWKGENAGNKILAEYVSKTKPKYYFCGHIHSGKHGLREIEGIKIANVSINNEGYSPVNEPLIFDI